MYLQLCRIAADSNSLSVGIYEKAATIEKEGNLPRNPESRGIRQTRQSTASRPSLVVKNIEHPRSMLKTLIYDLVY